MHKNPHRKPPHLPSHQRHEVEVCRGEEEVSEANVTLVPFFHNRADIIGKVLARDRLVSTGILPNVNFTYKTETETGCTARDKDLFPHHKVDEQPNKKPKKGYYFHKRRESDDKNAVASVKVVPQLGCVSQDSEALVSQCGKQYRGNPMQKVLGSIRKVRFTQSTLCQASIREKKGPSLGNKCQSSSSAKSLRCEIWGPVP